MLLPFRMVSAQIRTLRMDIPWSSLNSRAIKTYVGGLEIQLVYEPMVRLDEISTKTAM